MNSSRTRQGTTDHSSLHSDYLPDQQPQRHNTTSRPYANPYTCLPTYPNQPPYSVTLHTFAVPNSDLHHLLLSTSGYRPLVTLLAGPIFTTFQRVHFYACTRKNPVKLGPLSTYIRPNDPSVFSCASTQDRASKAPSTCPDHIIPKNHGSSLSTESSRRCWRAPRVW